MQAKRISAIQRLVLANKIWEHFPSKQLNPICLEFVNF